MITSDFRNRFRTNSKSATTRRLSNLQFLDHESRHETLGEDNNNQQKPENNLIDMHTNLLSKNHYRRPVTYTYGCRLRHSFDYKR